MKSNITLNSPGNQAVASDAVLKATALLYFKEALVKQEYEGCQELIDIAKGFGASGGEIKQVIASYIKAKEKGPGEAVRVKNRLRFKEGKA